jgi:hypothetical protein
LIREVRSCVRRVSREVDAFAIVATVLGEVRGEEGERGGRGRGEEGQRMREEGREEQSTYQTGESHETCTADTLPRVKIKKIRSGNIFPGKIKLPIPPTNNFI